MSDYVVRPITDPERRSTFDLLLRSLHGDPIPDERWGPMADSWAADGKTGAFHGDDPIGIASSFPTTLTVPGGGRVPMAAVDGVGVRADWTRRGVLTAMMDTQLHDFVNRGYVAAGLHASEAVIYGRFGYGAATSSATFRVSHPARLREGVTAPGHVRLLTTDEAIATIPALYQRIGTSRAGRLARPDRWWPIAFHWHLGKDGGNHRVAVHTGPDGDDGYVEFRTTRQMHRDDPERGALLDVRDLQAAGPEAVAGLWRFLLSVDLVEAVHVRGRPVDEPVSLLLADPRRARTTDIEDELWLRLVDVPGALAARTYGPAEPVVMEVHDRMLPDNRGRYRVGPDGVTRTDEAADLELDVDTLAMLYLGEWQAGPLALAGRITGADDRTLAQVDTLFGTAERPWSGTHF
ncbi:GNAT family N-acetyltransferase [Amycolatopsis jejuensis]|uniref:GNAT family N-acetyltransferase n=1 Tax=Amycolatopsis jejuensis TaxID=330084 RepID=UPI00052773AB|nr:GNAT family N-acetyltransferase [Amycolatopsis jejuensis]